MREVMKNLRASTKVFLIFEILFAVNIVTTCATKQVSLLTYVLSCVSAMLSLLSAELFNRANQK